MSKKHFTCIAYDNMDFLIPSNYVVSGIYLHVPTDAKNLVFNRETLPHIYLGSYLEREFNCKQKGDAKAVLVLNSRNFARDVASAIIDITDTAFPATSNVAISMTGNINSHEIELKNLRLLPNGISPRLSECGITAVRFNDDGRKQLLISPDALLRRYFAGGLI